MEENMPKLSHSSTIYLNRDCPRACPYCSIRRPNFPTLSGEEWKDVFDILHDYLGINFYLILGVEPLAMSYEDLSKIVRHLNEKDYEYAFYTTAPGNTFSKLEKLIHEDGLRNVSAGLDFVVEVYEANKHKLPKDIIKLNETSKLTLHQKSVETQKMLEYAINSNVEEVHGIITISRMNYLYLPELIDYLIDKYQNRLHIGINYVEYGHGKDFDFAPHKITPYHFTEKDIPSLNKIIDELERKSNSPKYNMVQIPFDYLRQTQYLPKLNRKCNIIIPTVDADGSLRRCGYRIGNEIHKYSVFDIPTKKEEIIKTYQKEVATCPGCLWAYPYVVSINEDLVNYRSDLWKKREEEVKKYYKGE